MAIQLAGAALAAAAQYSLGRQLCGRWAGLIAAGLLAANPDIARFHAYILTDSLYTSAVLLATWGIHRAAERRRGWYVGASLLVLAAALLRPNGWLLFPIAASYWLARAVPRRGGRWLVAGGIAGLCVLAVLAVPSVRAGMQFGQMETFLRRGEIVKGYEGWSLPMPADPWNSSACGNRARSGCSRVQASCCQG